MQPIAFRLPKRGISGRPVKHAGVDVEYSKVNEDCRGDCFCPKGGKGVCQAAIQRVENGDCKAPQSPYQMRHRAPSGAHRLLTETMSRAPNYRSPAHRRDETMLPAHTSSSPARSNFSSFYRDQRCARPRSYLSTLWPSNAS